MIKTSNTYSQKLKEVTDVILNPSIDLLSVRNSLLELKSLFSEVSGFDFSAEENLENIHLETGKAIAPVWAGMCIDDVLRTKRFTCGIDKAIQDVRLKKKSEPVTVLYCGTGPFATLVIPLITKYSPDEMQFILLEVNPISLQNVKKVIKGFDAEAYVKDYHLVDATTFQVPENSLADILVVECMQHALVREPQVAIVHNLLSQLRMDLILIPEEIRLYIGIIDTKLRHEQINNLEISNELCVYKNIESVFELNKEKVLARESVDQLYEKRKIIFTEAQLNKNNIIVINTEIDVYKNEKIRFNESGLTIPLHLLDLGRNEAVIGIETEYVLGNEPCLQITFII